jgi:hypothetical protein
VDPIRDFVEFPLEKPPVKRKPTWCREILKEAEKYATPNVPLEKVRNQINTQV